MPNSVFRKPYLEDKLQELGIPYDPDSITVVDINAEPPVVTIAYLPAATPEQIALGNDTLAAFDWRLRQPLALNVVRQALLTALPTNADRLEFLLAMLAHLIRNDPRAAAKLARLLDRQNIVVDEVVP